MARVISPGNERPGRTSRGATQHRIAAFSRAVQMASATVLSWAEWEMKTSRAIEEAKPARFYLPGAKQATEFNSGNRLCFAPTRNYFDDFRRSGAGVYWNGIEAMGSSSFTSADRRPITRT